MSLDEDHCVCFFSFANRVVRRFFNGGTKVLCSEVELHILNPLEVVPSRDLQSGEVEFVQIRHGPIKIDGQDVFSVMEKNQSIHIGVEHTGSNRHVLV